MNRIHIEADQPELLAGLIENALTREADLIQIGLRKTERRLAEFERKHGLGTTEFYARYSQGDFEDELEPMEWAGEYETLLRLREQHRRLKNVELCR